MRCGRGHVGADALFATSGSTASVDGAVAHLRAVREGLMCRACRLVGPDSILHEIAIVRDIAANRRPYLAARFGAPSGADDHAGSDKACIGDPGHARIADTCDPGRRTYHLSGRRSLAPWRADRSPSLGR